MKKTALVITDNRLGASYQAIAVAEQMKKTLDVVYSVLPIEYNPMVHLPNFFLSSIPLHIKNVAEKVQQVRNINPDIIVSAGRRSASFAVFLKKRYCPNAKIIQILKPSLKNEYFHTIILPQHDTITYAAPNIKRVIGALSDIKSRLVDSKKDLESNYPEIKNFIAVIVGGNNRNYQFNKEDGEEFLKAIRKISDNHSMTLFVTFSRRTPEVLKKLFKTQLSWPHFVYDPAEGGPNPYPGIIQAAQFIISTPDSISMCSESAATGNPIYIYLPNRFKAKKHRYFIQQLFDLGIARFLDINADFLEKYNYTPLDETKKIVDLIRKTL